MNEESKGITESVTRKQLREQIAALSQPRASRAVDVLAMIWNAMKGPLEPPIMGSGFASLATPTTPLHRVKLALLKSIHTGTFIDVQFYAYNKISNNLPSEPKLLFTSSIVIEEWGPAIASRK